MPSYVDLNTLHNPATSTAPPATWGDQARDNDQYLYERGPYICTSATRPGSPFEGQVIYETDTDLYYSYTGSAWIQLAAIGAWATWTPTVKYGGTTASISSSSTYTRIGRTIIVQYGFRITNLNGGSGTLTITRPVTGAALSSDPANSYMNTYGTGGFVDVSVGSAYFHSIRANTAADLVLYSQATPGVLYTHAVPVTVAAGASATGDEYYGTFVYQAAS